MTKRHIILGASLLIFFLAVAVTGRLLYDHNAVSQATQPGQQTLENQTPQGTQNGSQNSGQAGTGNAALSATATCANALSAKTTADNTQYATGTVLVAFNSTITLDQASTVLSGYGFSIEQGSNPGATFPSYHLVTASVPAGDEFTAICELQADSAVRSATLNVLFSLHD